MRRASRWVQNYLKGNLPDWPVASFAMTGHQTSCASELKKWCERKSLFWAEILLKDSEIRNSLWGGDIRISPGYSSVFAGFTFWTHLRSLDCSTSALAVYFQHKLPLWYYRTISGVAELRQRLPGVYEEERLHALLHRRLRHGHSGVPQEGALNSLHQGI